MIEIQFLPGLFIPEIILYVTETDCFKFSRVI